jgi:hypothetical protein
MLGEAERDRRYRNRLLGEPVRNEGLIHSDVWLGAAADFAERRSIAVYPVFLAIYAGVFA